MIPGRVKSVEQKKAMLRLFLVDLYTYIKVSNCSWLALVPSEKVEIAFANLLNGTSDVPRINEFTDYLVVNYIEQEALFPIQLLYHWEHEEKRTDNDLEGYNRRLSVFLKSHPNIWKFIEAIKVEVLSLTHLVFHYAINTLLNRGKYIL
jgi:hypothetical protein